MPSHRTLWEEGRQPGRLVVRAAATVTLLVVLVSLLLGDSIGFWFDVAFVLTCVAAALLVRPNDFFAVGVLPPLLMAGTVTLLALVDRGAIADEVDGLVQATVSGLAHHAGALVTGYGLTLAILALRQVAARNRGALRVPPQRHRPSDASRPAAERVSSGTVPRP